MADGSRFNDHFLDQRFQLLVNSVTDYALYMLEPDGTIASWNPGARRFKGYEADEIVGQHYSRFFTEQDRAAGLPQKALELAAREGRFEAEGLRVRKDGTTFWANAVIDPIRDDDGRLIGFAKITRDITEKRAAQQALLKSEQQFRLLVQGVRDYALYTLNPDGVVTNWNTGAEAIKGYSADEIVGRHFSVFYTPEDREDGLPGRALAAALRERKYENEAWRIRKDGTRFRAHVVIDPIFDDDGNHIGFAKITRDITERYEAQQELEEARASLFQAQKLQALGELTGGIAHDFNNHMTVIRGAAELLRGGTLSEQKTRRYLDTIVETVDRATTLTSHLLAFARRQALKPEPVDLNLRLDAFAEVVARTIGSLVEIRLDLARDLWPLEVDPAQLETALLNAAINARDAMPGGGRLTITATNVTEPDGVDMVCLSLADNGEGIPTDVLERVFDPFFTTKPVGKGTGLGLSQIHGFAAQSGGRAEIVSAPGKGTTLRLFLPRAHRIASAATIPVAVVSDGGGATILLVEDNEQVRHFAEALLAELDYRVVAAPGGEEALDRLDDVDILFTDVLMPGMSGIELAREARQRRPDLPVLLASGYSAEIAGGGAENFERIAKPYGAATLAAALHAARARGSENQTPVS